MALWVQGKENRGWLGTVGHGNHIYQSFPGSELVWQGWYGYETKHMARFVSLGMLEVTWGMALRAWGRETRAWLGKAGYGGSRSLVSPSAVTTPPSSN